MDEELGDINDLFGPGVLTSPVASPTGSPKNLSAPGSPTHAGGMPSINGLDKGKNRFGVPISCQPKKIDAFHIGMMIINYADQCTKDDMLLI